MSDASVPSSRLLVAIPPRHSRVLNYGLRPAKNIERKMMGEALARLAPLCPLCEYRYVGMGSEFFNDFSLYHQMLGIRDMVSIEGDEARLDRCEFNRPYKCIEVRKGKATVVLPQLTWNKRSIVWLDDTEKLNDTILSDVQFLVSQAPSGSMLIWTVNAEPWARNREEDTCAPVKQSEWPAKRLAKLRSLVGSTRVRSELTGAELASWGLAREFYAILTDEIRRALNDRNSASAEGESLSFRQCFHFRYADGQRMLTVGGLLLNAADAAKLGSDAFAGLGFVRNGQDALEIKPPTLTGREVRYLNRLLPHAGAKLAEPSWLSADDLANYREVYRYYPVFAEFEL